MVINFNRRFWPPYQRLLGFVSAGAIGAPRTACLQLVIDDLRWNSVTNHRKMAGEGGALQDLGGHVVDLACSFFDFISRGSIRGAKPRSRRRSGVFNFSLAGRAVG